MGIVKYSIGIDMSSTDFKVCFACLDEDFQFKIKSSGTFKNTFDEYERFKNWLNKWHKDKETPLFVLVEATGIYHEQLAWYLYKEGFKISVVLANRAKRYLQSLGLKSKNDKIDARGLAQMCAQQQLRLWQPISANIYKLRGYTRLHESLHQQLTIVKNQLHAIGFSMYELKEVRTTLEELSVSLKEQIRTIEQQLKKLIEEDEVLHEKYEKITLIKGISLISFAVIVAETDGFALINNQAQLVSYAGYDVVENQSGKKAGKTCISKKGNYRIRRILHMPALTAIRHENRFKTFYERIYERSGYKMKAVVAVQKKLLGLMYALWKNDQIYDPEYLNKHSNEKVEDSLSVDCEAIINKEAKSKDLASQDEHSTESVVSSLSVVQI